ncbi:hypothetical protein FRC10_007875 [Ceratobasidium sp. 414]|nr:hypothetical protein FRC10_007875 [Ceratobasidium sp. 414]
MFVLQECSICFEDFENERNPHSIPTQSIRKVVCTQQESPPVESEEETLLWQAIKSAVETPNEDEQRKSLVKHNSLESVREAGMSANLLIALAVLRMLVEAEQQIHALKDEADTAQAVEESLCDHISTLEAQLGGETSEKSASPGVLLAQVRALQSSMRLIKSDTSTIVRHLDIGMTPSKPLPPIQPRTEPQPATSITPDPPPVNTQRASWSSLLHPASSRDPDGPSTSTARTGSNPDADWSEQHVDRQAWSPQQGYFLSPARAPSVSGSDDTGAAQAGVGGEAPGVGLREDAPLDWAVSYEDDLPDLSGLQAAAAGSSGSQTSVARLAAPTVASGPVTGGDGFTYLPGQPNADTADVDVDEAGSVMATLEDIVDAVDIGVWVVKEATVEGIVDE